MKTTPVTPADLAQSVLAVPPLARHADLSLNAAANKAQIRHLEAGGVTTLLYGGNANLYNVGLAEYPALLDLLEEAAAPDSWVIPSIGPDYGRLIDQARILRGRAFPTAMALPMALQSTPAGVEQGLARTAEAFGRPLIIYVKSAAYLAPDALARLVDAGAVCAIKYAIEREDPGQDEYLTRLVDLVDRRLIVSGMGERPTISHLLDFKLAAFTSGSVCIAPRSSQALLRALKRGDAAMAQKLRERFLPLETLRDRLSQIRVMHEAVTLSGVADMGPMLPMLSNIGPEHHAEIHETARTLLALDAEPLEGAA
ncbi:dihydrodipicolinate synthase family protein [Aliidongia dinghuensis]|uniref:Dihydrodipicolinate synthase family protein n=1 Tax=Aliidongia dinghuensis TaxID=1867774 RepID=A0A8J2YRX8_9PROT|nr:dihydrodipicolinate synthase family protein [Aliidongia dinghuensis]GGF10382.1 dihydrodipicolinate synthase family protein [Aliidongia dinghuensis]